MSWAIEVSGQSTVTKPIVLVGPARSSLAKRQAARQQAVATRNGFKARARLIRRAY